MPIIVKDILAFIVMILTHIVLISFMTVPPPVDQLQVLSAVVLYLLFVPMGVSVALQVPFQQGRMHSVLLQTLPFIVVGGLGCFLYVTLNHYSYFSSDAITTLGRISLAISWIMFGLSATMSGGAFIGLTIRYMLEKIGFVRSYDSWEQIHD